MSDSVKSRPLTSARGLLGRTNHFISNASLGAILERHIPYKRLEQAAVPVHVVVTELKSGRATILTSGPAVPALLASCAVPGVFPPVEIGRRDYVDGGVANHTPITVAIELGAQKIYVLPVGYPWLNREPTNALGMALHALARIVEQKLDAEVAANRGVADIQVMPALDLADVSPADFSHTQELIDWGYRSARRQLGSSNAVSSADDLERPFGWELVVDATHQEALQRQVHGDVGDQQPDDDERDDPDQQPPAQRQRHFLGVRRTYPTPRTVWIKAGS